MTHLGDRVASLIDGQLPVDVSGKAMTHLASCPSCQHSADLERLTKQRLASLSTPKPGADLMQRLLDLSGGGTQGPLPPRPGYLSGPGVLGGPPVLGGSRQGPAQPMLRVDPSTRPPGRRPVPAQTRPAQSRPPGAPTGVTTRLSRTTRSRLAFAVAGAACLVGVGVAGGVAAGQPPSPVTPPVESFVIRGGDVPVTFPLDQQAATISRAIAQP